MEIQIGRVAATQAEGEKVRRYGDLLVRDHQTGDQAVMDFAARKEIQIPAPPGSPAEQEQMQKQTAGMEQLKQLSGASFDRAFTEAMIADHEKAIEMMRGAAEKVKDRDLRDLLQTLLPILEQHRRIAQELSREVTASR
jgi:putative membrane protein